MVVAVSVGDVLGVASAHTVAPVSTTASEQRTVTCVFLVSGARRGRVVVRALRCDFQLVQGLQAQFDKVMMRNC